MRVSFSAPVDTGWNPWFISAIALFTFTGSAVEIVRVAFHRWKQKIGASTEDTPFIPEEVYLEVQDIEADSAKESIPSIEADDDFHAPMDDLHRTLLHRMTVIRCITQMMDEEFGFRSDMALYTRMIREQIDQQQQLLRETSWRGRGTPALPFTDAGERTETPMEEWETHEGQLDGDHAGRSYALGAVAWIEPPRLFRSPSGGGRGSGETVDST
ncbi:hypothetical protein [Heliobacterium chlorum]|uniref:hypothetical protein n=1 Tax=Heliobacterium chlorum TaxID=2698 RepID=UPI001FAB4B08|nr:hypothetical protein [Heliobacterium chlorum]